MSRLTRDDVYMEMVLSIAKRSTCLRRNCGCVLVDQYGHVLATGYNGVPSGFPHCNESRLKIPIDGPSIEVYPNHCEGSFNSESGSNLERCKAVHAEQNALLQCKDVYEISTCYTTTKPCNHCVKLLLNTSCKRIVYHQEYSHDFIDKLWEESGRELIQYANSMPTYTNDHMSTRT